MAKSGMYRNDGISDHHKVWITQGAMTVVGYIGDGASKELANVWSSPFENDTLGAAAGTIAGAAGSALTKGGDIIQVGSESTTKTVMNTAQVWDGINPHEISLPLYLKAYQDAKSEVNDAIMMLEMFASPELVEHSPVGVGAIPKTCEVNIGRRIIFPACQIISVSSELDAPRDKTGYMTRNMVQLQIRMDKMTNRSKIQSLYK